MTDKTPKRASDDEINECLHALGLKQTCWNRRKIRVLLNAVWKDGLRAGKPESEIRQAESPYR